MTIDQFRSFLARINVFDEEGTDTIFSVEKVDGFIEKVNFYDPQKDSITSVKDLSVQLKNILDKNIKENVLSIWSSLYIFESKPFEITEPDEDDEPMWFTKKDYSRLILPLIRNKSIIRLCPELDTSPNYWGDIKLEFTNLPATKELAKSLIELQLLVPVFFVSGRLIIELETVVLLNWGYDLYLFKKS